MSQSEQGGAPLNQNQQHVQDYLDSLLKEPDIDSFLAHDLGLDAGEKLDIELSGEGLTSGQNNVAEPANIVQPVSELAETSIETSVVEDSEVAEDLDNFEEIAVSIEPELSESAGSESCDQPDVSPVVDEEQPSCSPESDAEAPKSDIEYPGESEEAADVLQSAGETIANSDGDDVAIDEAEGAGFELPGSELDSAEVSGEAVEPHDLAAEADIADIAQALEEVVVAEGEEDFELPADSIDSVENQSERSVGSSADEIDISQLEQDELDIAEEHADLTASNSSSQDLCVDLDNHQESIQEEAQATDIEPDDGSAGGVELTSPDECFTQEQLEPAIDTPVDEGSSTELVGEGSQESYELDSVDADEMLQQSAEPDDTALDDDTAEAVDEVADATMTDETEIEETEVSSVSEVNETVTSLPVGAAPSWVGVELNCVVVQVHGISIAIPMEHIESATSLENVSLSMDLAHDWILGQIVRGDHTITYVLDSASWMMPELYDPAKAEYQDLIMLQGGYWGIACDEMVRSIRIPVDKVAWAVNRSKRPWLLGTYMAERCAILDVDALVDQLNAAF